MNGIAVNPAADANPEPQSMPAGSVGACTPVESTSLPDSAHLTDRVSIDVRCLALAIVTTVVVVFALREVISQHIEELHPLAELLKK